MLDKSSAAKIREQMAYEEARKSPPSDFPYLPDIPAERYVDATFLSLETERMWKRAWLYAGHVDQLPKPGSWFVTRNLGSPLIIVRDLDGKFRAFYNTCQHRGAPLVTTETGEGRGLVCGYHGWTYALDGSLVAIRDKRDFSGLDFSCRSLVAVRCELLGNFIFVNEDSNASSLIEYLGPMARELEQYQFNKLRLVSTKSYEVASNVKVLLDAFLEVYHLKSIHKKTVDKFLNYRAMVATLWANGHSRMITPNRRTDSQDPGAVGMPRISTVTEIARNNNVSYNIFPNFVMPPSDSGVPILQFWPTSDRTCRVTSTWTAPEYDADNPDPRWEQRLSNWENVLDEDLQFAPQIQESVESKGFRGIPLSYQERRIYHWHEELDRRIGADRLPSRLAVKPVLEDWIEH